MKEDGGWDWSQDASLNTSDDSPPAPGSALGDDVFQLPPHDTNVLCANDLKVRVSDLYRPVSVSGQTVDGSVVLRSLQCCISVVFMSR